MHAIYSRKLRFRAAHKCAWRSGVSFRPSFTDLIKRPHKAVFLLNLVGAKGNQPFFLNPWFSCFFVFNPLKIPYKCITLCIPILKLSRFRPKVQPFLLNFSSFFDLTDWADHKLPTHALNKPANFIRTTCDLPPDYLRLTSRLPSTHTRTTCITISNDNF